MMRVASILLAVSAALFVVVGTGYSVSAQSTQGGNNCTGKAQGKRVNGVWQPDKVVCDNITCVVPAGSQCLVKTVAQSVIVVINGQPVQCIAMQCMCYKSQTEYAVDLVAGDPVCDATEFRDAMDPSVVVGVDCWGYCTAPPTCKPYNEVIVGNTKTWKCRCAP
jgi:hypothetical protein